MSQPIPEWRSSQARIATRRFRLALKALLSVHPHMTGTQATTFLYVAMSPDELTVSSLATLCGVSPNVTSRHLKDLGTVKDRANPNLRLLTVIQRAHDDRRQHRVVLTDRGVMVARMLAEIMRGNSSTELPEDT